MIKKNKTKQKQKTNKQTKKKTISYRLYFAGNILDVCQT